MKNRVECPFCGRKRVGQDWQWTCTTCRIDWVRRKRWAVSGILNEYLEEEIGLVRLLYLRWNKYKMVWNKIAVPPGCLYVRDGVEL